MARCSVGGDLPVVTRGQPGWSIDRESQPAERLANSRSQLICRVTQSPLDQWGRPSGVRAGASVEDGDGINFNMDAVHGKGHADESIHRIVITEKLVIDLNLLAFERVPLARVSDKHRELADI